MSKADLFFEKPIMNAAGTLGFYPNPKGPVDISDFGAFVTNPISKGPRSPANGERYLSFSGGFLLHTGLPNPGLSQAIRRYGKRWSRSSVPVIVHLLAVEPDSLTRMVERLENTDGVMGVELGLPPEIDPATAFTFTQAALGELPIIVRLPMEQSEDIALATMDAGASAVSLGMPRGMLIPHPLSPTSTGRKTGGVQGRLYGPSIFPLALKTVERLAGLGVPVIGAGGIYKNEDAYAMMEMGAFAIQLDAVLWKNGIKLEIP
jgi:dihydroorotate dehydrogenase (NAD+) catalytic subunit